MGRRNKVDLLVLASSDQLIWMLKHIFFLFFYKTSYLNDEVNCNVPKSINLQLVFHEYSDMPIKSMLCSDNVSSTLQTWVLPFFPDKFHQSSKQTRRVSQSRYKHTERWLVSKLAMNLKPILQNIFGFRQSFCFNNCTHFIMFPRDGLAYKNCD